LSIRSDIVKVLGTIPQPQKREFAGPAAAPPT